MKKNNIKKNFVWNLIGSTLNSITSLFFLIFVTRINGIEEAGIFTFAFSTACLLQVIGTYYGRAYQVTELNNDLSNNDFLYSRFFSCGLMIIFSFLFVVIRGYLIYKVTIIILLTIFKLIEAFSESIYAIIQKNDELYKVGISLFLKGLLGIILFLLLDLIFKNLIIAILGLISINIIILLFYDLRNIKKYDYERTKFNFDKVKIIFKSGFYTFLFTFLTQYVINAPKYAIDNNLPDKYQSIFGIIIMPATLMILCGQFMIQPFLMTLSNHLKEKRISEFSKLVFKIVGYILIFGILANIAAGIIGIPFLELVYGVDLSKYLKSLIIIITGATCYGMSYIISNGLVAMRKTFIQSIIFIIGSIFVLLLSNKLVILNGVDGAAMAYFLTMLLILILYVIVFLFEINKAKKNKI